MTLILKQWHTVDVTEYSSRYLKSLGNSDTKFIILVKWAEDIKHWLDVFDAGNGLIETSRSHLQYTHSSLDDIVTIFIPNTISFKRDEDYIAFKLRFYV